MSKVPKASLQPTDTCLPSVMVPNRHGRASLKTSELGGLCPTGDFCVFLYTFPGASRLTSPATAIPTSNLRFFSEGSFCSQKWGRTQGKLLPTRGSWAKNQAVYSLTNAGKNTQLLDTLAEDQTGDNLQDNDISVTAVNRKSNFKRRLNIVKQTPFISMKCPKSEITWPKSPFI